jgi:hypothetical protein
MQATQQLHPTETSLYYHLALAFQENSVPLAVYLLSSTLAVRATPSVRTSIAASIAAVSCQQHTNFDLQQRHFPTALQIFAIHSLFSIITIGSSIKTIAIGSSSNIQATGEASQKHQFRQHHLHWHFNQHHPY